MRHWPVLTFILLIFLAGCSGPKDLEELEIEISSPCNLRIAGIDGSNDKIIILDAATNEYWMMGINTQRHDDFISGPIYQHGLWGASVASDGWWLGKTELWRTQGPCKPK